MARIKFNDWLEEIKRIVKERFEVELENMPEFDISDATSYYKNGDSPSLYFRECLSEYGDGDEIREIMRAE